MTTHDKRFDALHERFQKSVINYFVRLGFSRDEAQDLAQEVFLRVFTHMDTYRGDAEWGFVKTTARNLAANVIRDKHAAKRSAHLVALDADEAQEVAAPAEPDLAERDEHERHVRQLYAAIEALPASLKQPMQLWLAGHKYKAIAVALKITEDAVKSRLRDTKKILRDQIGEAPEITEDEE